MEPELGNVDFLEKSGANMNMCWQTNGEQGCCLYVKIVGLTL